MNVISGAISDITWSQGRYWTAKSRDRFEIEEKQHHSRAPEVIIDARLLIRSYGHRVLRTQRWNHLHRFESIQLGEYKGDDYFLVGFVEPEPGADFDPETDANEYGVSLARTSYQPSAETIEIVRLDSAHSEPHLDKSYLPPDTNLERKIWLEDGVSYRWMKQYLLVYWKEFVDLYIRLNE